MKLIPTYHIIIIFVIITAFFASKGMTRTMGCPKQITFNRWADTRKHVGVCMSDLSEKLGNKTIVKYASVMKKVEPVIKAEEREQKNDLFQQQSLTN